MRLLRHCVPRNEKKRRFLVFSSQFLVKEKNAIQDNN